jgi:hypothetical protein
MDMNEQTEISRQASNAVEEAFDKFSESIFDLADAFEFHSKDADAWRKQHTDALADFRSELIQACAREKQRVFEQLYEEYLSKLEAQEAAQATSRPAAQPNRRREHFHAEGSASRPIYRAGSSYL